MLITVSQNQRRNLQCPKKCIYCNIGLQQIQQYQYISCADIILLQAALNAYSIIFLNFILTYTFSVKPIHPFCYLVSYRLFIWIHDYINLCIPVKCQTQPFAWTQGSPAPSEGPSYTQRGWTTPEAKADIKKQCVNMSRKQKDR